MDKLWDPLFVVSKIFTDKVLAGIMENPQIYNTVNVMGFSQPCVFGLVFLVWCFVGFFLFFFLMVAVVVRAVGVLGKDLNCAVNSFLTLEYLLVYSV